MPRTSINVVEGEPMALEGMRLTIDATDDLVAAGCWATLDERSDEEGAATFLVDISATGASNPFAAFTRLACEGHRVLVRGPLADPDLLQAVLEAGAHGALERSAGPDETVAALRSVSRGGRYVPLGALDALRNLLLMGERSRLGTLTAREWEILRHTASGASGREIATRLSISEPTVRTHLARTHAKLGVSGNIKAVVRLHRLGLLPRTPEPRELEALAV